MQIEVFQGGTKHHITWHNITT